MSVEAYAWSHWKVMITGYEELFSIPMESTLFLPLMTRLSGFGIPGIGDVPNDLMLILISARHLVSNEPNFIFGNI